MSRIILAIALFFGVIIAIIGSNDRRAPINVDYYAIR